MFHVEQFRRLFRFARARRFKYSPLISINIYRREILKNFDYFSSFSDLGIAPVLKSNAYGHDLIKVAKILEEKHNIPFLVIDNYYESLVLENEGIKHNFLIIGFTETENIISSTFKRTSFTINAIDQLRELSRCLKKRVVFHLKIDTGMNRQGIGLDEIAKAYELLNSNKHLVLEGICSHLAAPDNQELLERQRSRWDSAVKFFSKKMHHIKYFHVLATSGIAHHKQFFSNVARIGIGLFGFDISGYHTENIQPALSVQAPIASIKELTVGESVGYDATYTASKPMKIAVIPLGYYEGLDRKLSNVGVVKIQNIFCPLVGLVSMNICTVDVSEIRNVFPKEQVVVFSRNRKDPNSVQNISNLLGCTPYEVLVRIPQHLRRAVV